MKIHFAPLFLLFLLSILSCGNNDDLDVCLDISVSGLSLICVGDSGNASDLSIHFEIPQNETCIDHYRAYIVKFDDASFFDIQKAASIDTANYIRIEKTGSSTEQRLSSTAVDVDGDLIMNNQDYALFVLTFGIEGVTSTLSVPTKFTLEQKVTVEILTELPIGTAGIVVDKDGNIYSADFGLASSGSRGTIYKITPDGTASVFASGFTEPSGNTIGPDGNIYQADFSTGRISQVSMDGTVSNYVSGMVAPVGLTFGPSGNLYVANCLDNSIKKVTPTGQVSTLSSGSLFSCPNGISIDEEANLYVANFRNANLIKITPDGNASLFATLPGNNLGHVLIFENRLFAIARDANRIYEVSLNGDTTKIAGNGNRGHKTGIALAAEFSLPNDLGFSPDGKFLYINDAVQINGVPVAPSYLKRIRLE